MMTTDSFPRTDDVPNPRRASTAPTALVALAVAAAAALVSGAPADGQLVATDRIFFPGDEPGDRSGGAVAVGDFNGDGYDDLAVGVPDEDFGSSVARAGQVRTYLGGPGGISGDSSLSAVLFEVELNGGVTGAGHRFGAALAAADFDLDGFDDLAIGIPGRTVAGQVNAGGVAVVWGGLPTGIDRSRSLLFDQSFLTGTAEAGDQFGASLAAGRLGNEEHPDLAIGVPGEDIDGFADAGAVNLLFSQSELGLSPINNAFIHQNTTGVFGIVSPNDRFATALAIGDVTGDGINDLVVGTPGDLVDTEPGSGAVQIFPGEGSGVAINSDQELWNQDDDGVPGQAQTGDGFGSSLALGHFNGDLRLDLAIGVPGESEFGPTDSGVVQVLIGTVGGLSPNQGQLFFEGLVSPEVSIFDRFGETLAAGDFNADGQDDLAIGYHLDDVFGQSNSGNVAVLYAGPPGLQVAGAQLWNGFFLLSVEPGDELGFALAAGRFAGTGGMDLVIGVPGRENDGGDAEAGGVLIVRSQNIFSDGFETGTTDQWSAVVD